MGNLPQVGNQCPNERDDTSSQMRPRLQWKSLKTAAETDQPSSTL